MSKEYTRDELIADQATTVATLSNIEKNLQDTYNLIEKNEESAVRRESTLSSAIQSNSKEIQRNSIKLAQITTVGGLIAIIISSILGLLIFFRDFLMVN